MVSVYGGAYEVAEKHTIADYAELIKESGLDFYTTVKVITSVKIKAVNVIVKAAKRSMRMIQAVEKAVTHNVDEDGNVTWTGNLTQSTVDGFKFINDKRKQQGREYVFNIKGAQAAISPNWIHQRDASFLTRVVIACDAENIAVETVHDSFATVAHDYPRLQEILRDTWADMYADTNHIGEFIKENKHQIEAAKYEELAVMATMLYNDISNTKAVKIVEELGVDAAIDAGFSGECFANEIKNNPYGFM